MKESTQRKIILLLLVCAIISLLWAVGSNSRKKVELKKSETLESKLEKLVRSNTAIVNDLKAAHNRLSGIQRSERLLKKTLAVETTKNKEMKKIIEKATTAILGTSTSIEELAKDAEVLKNTNNALGEEILTLKEKDAALRLEIEQLKAQLTQPARNAPNKAHSRKTPPQKSEQEKDTNRNFTWE